MLAYTMRFKFPQTKYERDGQDMIKQNDKEAKLKMKRYADASHRSKPSSLQLDERVLLRNKRENKLTPAFDPQPYTVVGRNGSMISAKRGERVVTRNTMTSPKLMTRSNRDPLKHLVAQMRKSTAMTQTRT